MTDHTHTNTLPRSPAFPRDRKSGTRLPAARRGLRLAAVAAPLGLLLAVTAGAGMAPAQAAVKTGHLFAGHEVLARGAAPAPACASRAGTGWKRVPTPDTGNFDELAGVAVVSSCQAWAVGNVNSARTLIESWDGTAWTQQPSLSPGRDGNGLFGVAATSATDAWAVGNYATGAVAHTLIEHWDGTAWKRVPSPSPNGSTLVGVDATSPASAWAVGHYATASRDKSLILHWNGRTWTKVASPNRSPLGYDLFGVAASSPANVWAVGIRIPFGDFHTLAVHCC
jgi:hypothetical protein